MSDKAPIDRISEVLIAWLASGPVRLQPDERTLIQTNWESIVHSLRAAGFAASTSDKHDGIVMPECTIVYDPQREAFIVQERDFPR